MTTLAKVTVVLAVAMTALATTVLVRNRLTPPPPPPNPNRPLQAALKVDTIEFALLPGGRVEYKFRLAEGATMVYSWKADGPLVFSLHTVPDGKPISASESFEDGERAEAHGTYTAPYPGLHGWFWENKTNDIVSWKLEASGFFTGAVMFSDGEQIPMEVRDPPPPPEQ